jgi:hypothetical protein
MKLRLKMTVATAIHINGTFVFERNRTARMQTTETKCILRVVGCIGYLGTKT